MGRLIFCNIGWMSWYRGLVKQPDKIVGGGRYVRDNGSGHEVCNFLGCNDGYIYGHVESIQGETDRQIHIEKWGGSDDSLSGVDIIWMATHPEERGRRVIGWYRNATIFRSRQEFRAFPSRQHRLDRIDNYRVCALATDAHLLNVDERVLVMPRGRGWMGQTQWWSPGAGARGDVAAFLRKVRGLVDGTARAAGEGRS